MGAFPNWTENNMQAAFLSLMEIHRDKIILEVTGHDHLAGLRAAKVPERKMMQRIFRENSEQEYYLNKVIFPGMTGASDT